jgi:bifunctional enzyme Fae/Hps
MLNEKQKYLQIALNSTLEEARAIISQIPLDERIILEAGTPLIKNYGAKAIETIKRFWEERIFGFQTEYENPWLEKFVARMTAKTKERKILRQGKQIPLVPYIVADLKCMDRGEREVQIAKIGGASGAVVLGQAPVETINAFIETCEKYGLDAMVDMMNVNYPLEVLRKLKKLPKVVILHRGVDEEKFNPESEIPYHEIHRIKENYDIMIAIAGGDTINEVQRAIFNDADIVVVWKSFYKSTAQTAKLAHEFLKEIR